MAFYSYKINITVLLCIIRLSNTVKRILYRSLIVYTSEEKKARQENNNKNRKLCLLNSMCIKKIFCKFYITRYR